MRQPHPYAYALVALSLTLVGCEREPQVPALPRVTVPTAAGGVTFAFENRDGLAIAEGDILLGPYDEVLAASIAQGEQPSGDLLQPPAAGLVFSLGSGNLAQRWPLEVPYSIADDLPDPQRIQDAFDEYEKRTPLRFVEHTSENDLIHFHTVFNPFAPNASYSALGRQGGQQGIGITDNASVGTVVHEIGHALGLFHEQARPDRDSFVDIHLECVPLHLQYNFRKLGDWFWDSGIALEVYDTQSVMHYDSCTFSTNPSCVTDDECRTIVAVDGSTIRPSSRLTVDDVNGLHNMYGRFPAGNNEFGDAFGHALAAGDFDNDGHIDLAVGARGDRLGTLARGGSVYLLKGTDSGLTAADTLRMTPALGMPRADALFGTALVAHDFNDDGVADLAVGARGYDIDGGSGGEGAVFLYYGKARERLRADRGVLVTQATGDTDHYPGAAFGSSVAAGDMTGDGLAELFVGAPRRPGYSTDGPAAGFVYMLLGTADGPANGLNVSETFPQGFDTPAEAGDAFGNALAVGDFNNDGLADVAVGAPGDRSGETRGGAVFIFHGSASGPSAAVRLSVADFDLTPANGDDFGGALAVGDFDDQPGQDLAVGAIRRDAGAEDTGTVFLYRGGTAGLVVWESLSSPAPAANAHFGFSVAAGDFDTDGDTDLAISAVDEDTDGAVHLFRRQDAAFSFWTTLSSDAHSPEVDDHFGHGLAVGDFDEDGRADLAVSIPLGAPPAFERAGLVVTFGGRANGETPARRRMFHQQSPPPNGQ